MDNMKLNSIHSFTKILVVDSLLYVARTLSKVLSEAGYFVMTASDKEEALDKITKFSPDLVTIGQKLHDISGLDFARIIKDDIGRSQTKIIFITSKDDKEVYNSISSLGTEQVVTKPIDNDKLLSAVNELCHLA